MGVVVAAVAVDAAALVDREARPALRGHRVGRWLVIASIAGALAPIVIAGLRAALDGWIPTFDDAYPALRASDVFSRHPPLLGTRSGASLYAGQEVNHPGPLEFFALAPWVRMFGLSAGTAMGVAFLNTLSVLGVAWLAFRRGGAAATVIAMAALASLSWTMGSQMLFDPWPPHVSLFPFALLLLAGWSVADGDLVALPVLAACASFVVQTHLSYVILAPSIVLTSLAMLAWRVATRSVDRRRLLRWTSASGAVALLCWLPPLYEQVSRGGNLASILGSAGERSDGGVRYGFAVRLFAGTVALPPWWLPPSFEEPAADFAGHGPSVLVACASLVALGAFFVVGAVRARRRGSSTLATGLCFMLITAGPLLVSSAYGTYELGAMQVEFLRFLWVYAALVGAMATLVVIDEVRPRLASIPRVVPYAKVVPALAAVVAGLLALPTKDLSHISPDWSAQATRDLSREVLPVVRGKGPVLVVIANPLESPGTVGPGLLVSLRDAGVPFVVREPQLLTQIGRHRAFRPGSAGLQLIVTSGVAPVPSSTARLVAEVPGRTAAEDAELAELRRTLTEAIEASDGLPLRPHPPDPGNDWLRDQLDRVVGEIEAEDRAPRELIRSGQLSDWVFSLTVILGRIDDVIDGDRFPVDDLARFVELEAGPRMRGVRVYTDRPPRA